MDRIDVGMHVDIKRSDGRIHTAIVTELRKERQAVMVEWFEKGETKGKEIDFDALLQVNPTLRSVPASIHVASRNIGSARVLPPETDEDNDENDTLYDLNIRPKAINTTSQQNGNSHRRRTAIFPNAAAPVPVPVEQTSVPVARTNAIPAPKSRRAMVSTVPSPSAPKAPAGNPMKSSVSALTESSQEFEKTVIREERSSQVQKGNTVRTIENIEREREERRANQERIKKAKEMERAIDPGNQNYQFYSMIRDYRANLDYRPLKMSDHVPDSRISVCVRKRPLNSKETNKKEIEVVTIPNRDHIILHQPQVKVDMTKYLENQKFRFDFTFDENSSNEMVYKFTAQPLVRTIFEKGFATCFAYGQTGSGKTHTMGGDFSGKSQDVSKGIYALVAKDVFKTRNMEFSRKNLQVYCSFFEIYGGKVFDLLNGKKLLRVLEDGKKEVNVVGLQEEEVQDEYEVMNIIKKGTDIRTAGSTSANSNSSRSHAVFQIQLKQGKNVWGKFSLIDLAGNERGQDTGDTDRQTRVEGSEINKSLLALKECIRAMAKNSGHIPFRGSKLTLVLRDSFVGENARTCMIAMVSPGMSSCEHTLNTLRYADRVKELGADDGEVAPPMDDGDLFINRASGGLDEEENDDGDLSLVCSRSGADRVQFERMKIVTAIANAEEATLTAQSELGMATKRLESLMKRSEQVDYDQDKYLNDLFGSLRLIEKYSAEVKANASKWQQLIQKEGELSKQGRR